MNVYDFDGTIYDGDSTVDFYLFCVKKNPFLLRYLPIQVIAFGLYFMKKIDKTHLKEQFFSFLKGVGNVDDRIIEFTKAKACKIQDWYLTQKKETDVIITASPYFIVAPLMKMVGITNIIASDVDKKTGSFRGKNCHDTEKLVRFQQIYGNSMIDKFYSDSESDQTMADHAKEAYLVKNGKVKPWKRCGDNREL